MARSENIQHPLKLNSQIYIGLTSPIQIKQRTYNTCLSLSHPTLLLHYALWIH